MRKHLVMLTDIQLSQFKEKLCESDKVVVLVYTSMCGTCESAKRMMHVVSESLKEIGFYQININLNPELIKRYDISSVPCFLLFKKGILVDQFYAFHSVTYLFEKINSI